MTRRHHDLARWPKRARAAAKMVADEAREAEMSADDQMRAVARQAFEQNKAARERAAKPAD